jgi:solute carrier family 35 protein C2
VTGRTPGNYDPDDIEMESMAPTGHRRRRSSIKSTSTLNGGNGRPHLNRSASGRRQDEPKISEEAMGANIGETENKDEDTVSDEDLHDDEETGLTRKERRRKKQKKKRNTRLDQRIIREKITAEDKKAADQDIMKKLLLNASLIGLWYFFSLCLSLVCLL